MFLSLLTAPGFILGQTEGCRGFGFVVFALVEDAQKAVNTVTTLHGRRLFMCFANKKPKREKRKQGENAVDESHEKDAKDGQSKLTDFLVKYSMRVTTFICFINWYPFNLRSVSIWFIIMKIIMGRCGRSVYFPILVQVRG